MFTFYNRTQVFALNADNSGTAVNTNTENLQPTMDDLVMKVGSLNPVKIGETLSGKVIFLTKNQCFIEIENIGIGVVRGRELYNEEYLSRLKVGEEIEGIVLNLDNEMGYLEMSFRAIGRDKIWAEIVQYHEKGEIIDAKIKDVNRGGFLVGISGGIEGFLPASLLSSTHSVKQINNEDKSLQNQMKKYLGQTFKVKITNLNPESDSVIVSEKAVSEELIAAKLAKYKASDIVDATVIGIVDFGLFVRFDDDIDGLVHISEIAWKKVENPSLEHKIGDNVKVKILEIDKDHRINLSIRQTTPNPWTTFAKNNKPGEKFKGKITKIVSYGAIVVDPETDIQGLCHISQLSEKPLESPAKIYELIKVGDVLDFIILNLEGEENSEKLYLSRIKDLETAQKIQAEIQNKQNPNKNNSENSQEKTEKPAIKKTETAKPAEIIEENNEGREIKVKKPRVKKTEEK